MQKRLDFKKRGPKEKNQIQLFDLWKDKYGIDFVSDLFLIRQKPFFGITDLAKKYGMTKQYVSQLFTKMFKIKYEVYEKEKQNRIKQDIESMGCKCDPRQAFEFQLLDDRKIKTTQHKQLFAQVKFIEECEKRNIKYEIIKRDKFPNHFLVNNYRISITYLNPSKKFYQIQLYRFKRNEDSGTIDYFIAYLADENNFAIIPNDNFKGLVIYKKTENMPIKREAIRMAFIDRWDYLSGGRNGN